MNKRCCILIVDDEPINIMILENGLKDEYEICTAKNGYDAIRQIKEAPPALILLDVMMPELSGFDVCRIIKADAALAEIPIIFLTAIDTLAGETVGLKLGGIDYMTKPVNIELLRLRVHNHIDLKLHTDLVREQRDLLARQKEELEEALVRIKRLEGIIPICMHCKAIRKDDASWQRLESYFMEHTDALFSHGICPTCLAQHYPEYKEK